MGYKLLKQYEYESKKLYDAIIDAYLLIQMSKKVSSKEEIESDKEMFRRLNDELLHEFVESDNVLVPLPDINNPSVVIVLEIDKPNDGNFYTIRSIEDGMAEVNNITGE